MEFKVVVVDIKPTCRQKRLGAFALATAIALAASMALAAPKTFAPGETLSAADLNDSLGGLNQRLAALENQVEEAPGLLRFGSTQISYGVATPGATGYTQITFAQPFLDNQYTITATAGDAGTAGGFAQVAPIDAATATLQYNNQADRPVHWVAVGRWE